MGFSKKMLVPAAVGVVVLVVVGSVLVFKSTNHQSPPAENVGALPTATALANDPAADSDYQSFYTQKPDWSSCFDTNECTTVKVPVDWAKPAGETLDLAVVRAVHTSKGKKRGSVLLNPGGPGASGYNYVGKYAKYVVTPALNAQFDVIGFDPRGVGKSAGVDCVPDNKLDAFLFEDTDSETPAGLAKARERAKEFADGCVRLTGPLLAHVDTISAARDMDVIRAVVGDDRLNYLGKSYGTLLGATYAGLFPNRVGRLVLDGAIDPTLTSADLSLQQAQGIESAFSAYLKWCVKQRKCPFNGTPEEGLQRVKQFLDELENQPLPMGSDSRVLTPARGMIGMVTPLYTNQTWPRLSEALTQAFKGDGSGLGALADEYADRKADGSYDSNMMEAFTAVNCLDYAVDDSTEAITDNAEKIIAAAPVFGRYMSYGEPLCGSWPHEVKRDGKAIKAAGAPPILVVGTTNDMATPYAWSQRLAEQLDSGRLLTFEGEGHTAYRRQSACIDQAVDEFFLKDLVPVDGAKCAS